MHYRPDRGKRFQFAPLIYYAEALENAKHPYDLKGKERQGALLRMDQDCAALGTAACGPGGKGGDEVGVMEKRWKFVLEAMG